MLYLYAVSVVLLNLVWLFLTVLTLPGNWLMVLTAAVVAWLTWQPAPAPIPGIEAAAASGMFDIPGTPGMFGIGVLLAATALAGLGELLEFFLGAVGARKAGGSRRAAAASILGAVVGGIVATFIIPIPILGTLIGVCGGAFLGAASTELLIGKQLAPSIASGRGAAVGRLWGTLAKLAVGVVIYILLAVAAFV